MLTAIALSWADRSVDPLDIVKSSLRDNGWRLETLRAAGFNGAITGMAKIDITETARVWPGKDDEGGTLKGVPCITLPFQVVEAVKDLP